MATFTDFLFEVGCPHFSPPAIDLNNSVVLLGIPLYEFIPVVMVTGSICFSLLCVSQTVGVML